jgi:DNA polymerase IV (DinB-like DNA polymerase)
MADSERIILHVDMDSFFASVEIRENSSLAGLPVIVGADPRGGAGRGVVSTCSYEARRYGVHSGMPISRAYVLCPQAVYLPVNHALYARVSNELMEILKAHADRFQQVSIDEAYLDVTGAGSFPAAAAIGAEIKREIRDRQGLTCSVGVAPSKVVAKIASDYRKPDGLTVIPQEQVAAFLAPLPAGKIPGIGPKTGEELKAMGILTIGDLARCNVQDLIARFGRSGIYFHHLALGNDDREVQSRDGCKSLSRETTFEEDTDDPSLLFTALAAMAGEVSEALVAGGLRGRTVTVKVRYQGFATHTRSRTLDHFTDDREVIARCARDLLRPLLTGARVRLLGIRISSLECDRTGQTALTDFFP